MLNHIVIMGRLTRDPELRTTQSGINVASFTVAVDRDFSGRDGGERQTDFIDCVAWRYNADFVSRNFSKGKMIIVLGRLQSRKWQDREGNNRISWEIQAENVLFGESKRASEGYAGGAGYSDGQSSFGGQNNSYGGYDAGRQSAPAPQVNSNPFEELEDDGDLPF